LSNWLESIRPLHDRIIVKHLAEPQGLIHVVRENPLLVDYVGQGDNGSHDDNRRVFLTSTVISVGSEVRGVKKGDIIRHTAWDDLPESLRQRGWAMIREGDVAGRLQGAQA
jgi:hypothetical protein